MRPQLGRYATLRCQISAGMRGALRDREDLVERRIDLRALGSLVGDVDAAVRRGDLGERDQFVGRREPTGHVLQRRADAQGAVPHRLGDQVAHALRDRRAWPGRSSSPIT